MSEPPAPSSGARRVPRWVWPSVRFLVVGAIFALLVTTGHLDPAQLRGALANPLPFLAGVALLMVGGLVSVLRWQTLLVVHGIRVPWWDAVRLTFIGLFFSTAIPGAVTGDVVKAWYVVRGRPRKADAIMTILLDRILGMYTMVLVAAVVLVLGATTTMTGTEEALRSDARVGAVAVFMVVLFVAMTGGLLAASNARLRSSRFVAWLLARVPFRETVRSLYDAVHLYGRHPGRSALALVYSLLAQLPLFAGLACMAGAAGAEGISVGAYLFILPVGLIVNALPILPAGLGQGEAAFEWLFALFGSDSGAETAFLFHVAMIGIAVGLGGAVYLFWRKDLDIRMETGAADA